jgi:WD40 repeat protein/energy-coupling factor transporter ATP-binding protein EcfA2
MTDPTVHAVVSGGQVQGVAGAGSVVIENFTIYNRAVEEPVDTGAEMIPPCPYPGLAYFGPSDADLFFGRDAAINRLAEAVGRQSFTALVGASGSGKSSVVLAGLAPRLHGAGNWRFSHFRIGTELESNPFLAMARALAPLYVASDSDVERLRNTKLLATSLAAGELTLRDVFADCRSRNKGRRILLIADQFEEVFTLVEDDAVRSRFVDVLLAGFPDPTAGGVPDICLILTMRADFYGRALRHRPLADALQNHVENLGPMNREELQAAIVNPAQSVGVAFEPGMVEILLDTVQSRPGGLPLLQFALREMWGRQERKKITRESYDEIGGVEGALAQHAETVFAGLTKNGVDREMEKAFQRLFTRLVTLGEGQEDTRRVVERAELGDQVWGLAQRLAGEENRLVVTTASSARETAEVVHEALIRHWPKLVDWINRDRAFQSWLRQIKPNMELWSANPADDGPLLRGGMLAQAMDWLARRRDDLSPAELAFIEASLALRRREDQERDAARLAEIRRQQELAEAAVKLANEQRRRARIAILGAIAAVVLAVFGGYEAYTASQNKTIAEKQGAIALSRQLATQASSQIKADQLDLALLLSVEAARVADTSEARSVLFTSLQTKPQLLQYVRARGASIDSMAADGHGKRALLGTSDGGLILWDIENQRQSRLWRARNGGPISAVTFDQAGQTAALVADDNLISIWSLSDTPRQVREFRVRTGKKVSAVALSPNGKSLAAGDENAVTLWNPESGEPLDPGLASDGGEIYALTFSPDGHILAAAYNHTVVLWDLADRKRIDPPLNGHPLTVNSVAYSPDGKTLATASGDEIVLWDASTHRRLGEPSSDIANDLLVRTVRFIGNDHLISAGDGGAVTRWSVVDGHLAQEPVVEKFHGGGIDQIAVISDGTAMALRVGGRVVLWDPTSGRSLGRRLKGPDHAVEVSAVALDGGGRLLALGGKGASTLWDTVHPQQVGRTLAHPGDQADSIALSPDGKVLAVGTCGVIEHDARARHNGKTCRKGKIIVWRLASTASSEPAIFMGHEGQVTKLRFTPDGTTLASAGLDRTVMLWNVADGGQRGFPVKSDDVIDLAFAPDGNEIFVRGIGGTLRGKLTRQGLEGGGLIRMDGAEREYPRALGLLAYSGDGNTRALLATAGSVVLWDNSTRRELGPELVGHAGSVNTAAFSGDGQLLATVDERNEIFLWDLNPSAWADRACAIANRNLSWDEWVQSFPDRAYRKTCNGLPVPYSVVHGVLSSTHPVLPGGVSTSALAEAAMAWAEEIGNPDVFNALCWERSLAGMAKMVLPFCERAVALAPSRADFRDSRGLSRALTGDYPGAIDDFTYFAKWKKKNSEGDSSESWKQREDWIAELEKGESPFDPKTLADFSYAVFSPAE